MKSVRSLISVVLFLLCGVVRAAAQTDAAALIVSVVKPRMTVSITDDRGQLVEGRVANLSDRAVRVRFGEGIREVLFDRILRIEDPDRARDGALRGFGVGFVIGLVTGVAAVGDNHYRGGPGAGDVISIAVGMGLYGALFGAGIDALADNRHTLYQRGDPPQARVSPIIGRGVAGAAVSLRW